MNTKETLSLASLLGFAPGFVPGVAMRHTRLCCQLVLVSIIAAPLAGQQFACSKLLLFPLRSKSFDVPRQVRADLNLYHYCAANPATESEMADAGVEPSVVYDGAGIVDTAANRWRQLATWRLSHCSHYTAAALPQLRIEIDTVLKKANPLVQKAYERCSATSAGFSCFAAPVGLGAVTLLFLWHPPLASSPHPELLNIRATGVVAPGDLLDGVARDSLTSPEAISSLQGLKIPPEGVVRGLLRPSAGNAVTLTASSTAGNCSIDIPQDEIRRPGVFELKSGTNSQECNEHQCLIELNTDIVVRIADLPLALEEMAKQKRSPEKAGTGDLVPILNGIPIPGVYPINPGSPPEEERLSGGQVEHRLRFHIERIDGNDANKKAWSQLLANPVFRQRVEFTVGFENGAVLYTWLTRDSKDQKIELAIVPPLVAGIGAMLIGGALILFLALVGRTDLIRDTTTALRPDGRKQLSLARAQMAFWFFLVAASYFGIWMITGDKDTISVSVLTLIGISAGTALGSAVVDAGKIREEEVDRYVVVPELLGPDVQKSLRDIRESIRTGRQKLQDEFGTIPATDVDRLEANRRAQTQEKDKLDRINRQIEFFSLPKWRRALNDLLSDGGSIGFHRFQIFVWTLVLGVIFVSDVFSDLKMPQFSSTLLAIMGISGGTYIGFKLPDTKQSSTNER